MANHLSLVNVNNSCFANTCLQVLFHNSKVRNFFMNRIYLIGSSIYQPICEEISRIFLSHDVKNSACRLRHLVSQSTGLGRYKDGTHQDSLDFFEKVLTEVRKELSPENEVGHIFLNSFEGKTRKTQRFLNSTGQCPSCEMFPLYKEDMFISLLLNVPENKSNLNVSQLISEHFSESNDIFSKRCSYCCVHGDSTCPGIGVCTSLETVGQTMCLKYPEILVIGLNQINPFTLRKNKSFLVPSDVLILGQDLYELESFAVHYGDTMDMGHDIAYIKDSFGNWTLCNDSVVTHGHLDIVKKQYIQFCIYSKKTSSLSSVPNMTTENSVES